jgi:hypothetical protein
MVRQGSTLTIEDILANFESMQGAVLALPGNEFRVTTPVAISPLACPACLRAKRIPTTRHAPHLSAAPNADVEKTWRDTTHEKKTRMILGLDLKPLRG